MKLVVFRTINLFTNITYFHVSAFFDFLIFLAIFERVGLYFLYILSKSHQTWSACQHNIYVSSKILIITFF